MSTALLLARDLTCFDQDLVGLYHQGWFTQGEECKEQPLKVLIESHYAYHRTLASLVELPAFRRNVPVVILHLSLCGHWKCKVSL